MEDCDQNSPSPVDEIARILALGILRQRLKDKATQGNKAVDFSANGSVHAEQEVPHE